MDYNLSLINGAISPRQFLLCGLDSRSNASHKFVPGYPYLNCLLVHQFKQNVSRLLQRPKLARAQFACRFEDQTAILRSIACALP